MYIYYIYSKASPKFSCIKFIFEFGKSHKKKKTTEMFSVRHNKGNALHINWKTGMQTETDTTYMPFGINTFVININLC